MRQMLVGILLVSSCVRAGSFTDGNEYSIKAMFLLNFIKYVEWPVESSSRTFKIGVVGDSEIYEALTSLAMQRSSEGQKVEIRRVDEKNAAAFQMIFISNSENNKMDELIKQRSAKGVLIVSEDDKGKNKPAGINLFNQDNKIRFEINLSSVKNNGMKVSSKLIDLATTVHH